MTEFASPWSMRVAHVALRVPDLEAAVDWFSGVLHLAETERRDGRSYMTCNGRHHELILVEAAKRGYDHMALEVPDAAAVEAVVTRCAAVGGKRLGPLSGEPGVVGGELLEGPGGHVFKIFHGMADVEPPAIDPSGVRPSRFEHISLKVLSLAPMERFLQDGLGFEFSDRLGPMASWWHCEAEHHGIALQRAPQGDQLHHHAWTQADLNAMGATADLLHERGQRLVWGPGHHGPGDNRFIYFKDPAGSLVECCSGLAMFDRDQYSPRNWPFRPISVSLWGGIMPPKFIAAGTPARHSGG